VHIGSVQSSVKEREWVYQHYVMIKTSLTSKMPWIQFVVIV
jgi:hypothetical protein